ncbi:uncharacterized protein LOC106660944 [Cimex lectularius]|uniref:Uncharacterized protein n=1 Tax=Cimex lectularius TaxID=79782 RepID=A0A8I6R6I3_CIMLE|nr:uncharacterized protein LOC106660944 [Cimex lectularius]
MDLRNEILNLKTLFYTHLVLISCTLLGSSCVAAGSMGSYMLYNLVYIYMFGSGILLHDKHEPLEMALVINVISGILDLVLLVSYPPPKVVAKISGILNMVIRVVSHIVLNKEAKARQDTYSDGLIGGGLYQNIDESIPNA